MSDYFNLEYKVLKWATDKLCVGIRPAHKTLCRVFFSKDLLTREIEHMCSDNTIGRDTFIQTMVATLQDRVRNDPKAYYTIIEILKGEPGVSYLARILEDQMIAEQGEKTEGNEVEKKQRGLGVMEAEKEHKKVVEDECVNALLHYHDMTGLAGHCISHRPADLPTSETQAGEYLTRTTEARNISVIGSAGSGEVEPANRLPQMPSFGSQKQVGCTEGGDSLPVSDLGNLPGHGIDCSSFTKPWQQQSCKLKMKGMEEKVQRLSIVTGTESQIESESRENYDMLPSLVSHDQMPATPSLDVAKDLLGNEVTQSNTINERIAQESISEEDLEKKRETKHDQGWKEYAEVHGEELSEEENGGAETWAMESTRSRSSAKSVAFRIPTNIYRHSTSVFSDNSDIFETPRVSVSNSLESSISPREIEKTICSHCEFLCRKVQEQREDFLRQLDFGKQERNKMLTYYETEQREMASKLCHLKLKLEIVLEQMNMKQKTECVKSLIAKHEKHKEVQKMKQVIKRLKKGKEKAEREREWAHQEKEWVEKDLDRAEKELDKAERERDDERSSRLEMELLYINGWPKPVWEA